MYLNHLNYKSIPLGKTKGSLGFTATSKKNEKIFSTKQRVSSRELYQPNWAKYNPVQHDLFFKHKKISPFLSLNQREVSVSFPKVSRDGRKESKIQTAVKKGSIYQYLLSRLICSKQNLSLDLIIDKGIDSSEKGKVKSFQQEQPYFGLSKGVLSTPLSKVGTGGLSGFYKPKSIENLKSNNLALYYQKSLHGINYKVNKNKQILHAEQFKEFFPYRKSFLCYWLLPFVGFAFIVGKDTPQNLFNNQAPTFSSYLAPKTKLKQTDQRKEGFDSPKGKPLVGQSFVPFPGQEVNTPIKNQPPTAAFGHQGNMLVEKPVQGSIKGNIKDHCLLYLESLENYVQDLNKESFISLADFSKSDYRGKTIETSMGENNLSVSQGLTLSRELEDMVEKASIEKQSKSLLEVGMVKEKKELSLFEIQPTYKKDFKFFWEPSFRESELLGSYKASQGLRWPALAIKGSVYKASPGLNFYEKLTQQGHGLLPLISLGNRFTTSPVSDLVATNLKGVGSTKLNLAKNVIIGSQQSEGPVEICQDFKSFFLDYTFGLKVDKLNSLDKTTENPVLSLLKTSSLFSNFIKTQLLSENGAITYPLTPFKSWKKEASYNLKSNLELPLTLLTNSKVETSKQSEIGLITEMSFPLVSSDNELATIHPSLDIFDSSNPDNEINEVSNSMSKERLYKLLMDSLNKTFNNETLCQESDRGSLFAQNFTKFASKDTARFGFLKASLNMSKGSDMELNPLNFEQISALENQIQLQPKIKMPYPVLLTSLVGSQPKHFTTASSSLDGRFAFGGPMGPDSVPQGLKGMAIKAVSTRGRVEKSYSNKVPVNQSFGSQTHKLVQELKGGTVYNAKANKGALPAGLLLGTNNLNSFGAFVKKYTLTLQNLVLISELKSSMSLQTIDPHPYEMAELQTSASTMERPRSVAWQTPAIQGLVNFDSSSVWEAKKMGKIRSKEETFFLKNKKLEKLLRAHFSIKDKSVRNNEAFSSPNWRNEVDMKTLKKNKSKFQFYQKINKRILTNWVSSSFKDTLTLVSFENIKKQNENQGRLKPDMVSLLGVRKHSKGKSRNVFNYTPRALINNRSFILFEKRNSELWSLLGLKLYKETRGSQAFSNFAKTLEKNNLVSLNELLDKETNLAKQRKSIQKKSRMRKLKKETSGKKKRKRYYPRPVWLRFKLFSKFVKKRAAYPISLNFSLGSIGSPNQLSQSKTKARFLKQVSQVKNKLERSKASQRTNDFFSSSTAAKEYFTISRPVLGDLKRLLWKSYWLRSNLNPYLETVKNHLSNMKESTQKWEFLTNFKIFFKYLGGFPSPFVSAYQNKDKNPQLANMQEQTKVVFTSPNKWESSLYFAEYNRITYLRLQEFISQIRDNFVFSAPQPTRDVGEKAKMVGVSSETRTSMSSANPGSFGLQTSATKDGRKEKEKVALKNLRKQWLTKMKAQGKVRSSHVKHSKIQDNKRDEVFSKRKTVDFWVKLGKAITGENQSILKQSLLKRNKEWWVLGSKDYTNEPTIPKLRVMWALSKTSPSLNLENSATDSLLGTDSNNKLDKNLNSFLYKRKQLWVETGKIREEAQNNKTKKMYRDITRKCQSLLDEQYELAFASQKLVNPNSKVWNNVSPNQMVDKLLEKRFFPNFPVIENSQQVMLKDGVSYSALFRTALNKTRQKNEKLQFLNQRKKAIFSGIQEENLREYKKQIQFNDEYIANSPIMFPGPKTKRSQNLTTEPWLNTLTSKSSYWWANRNGVSTPINPNLLENLFPSIEDSHLQYVNKQNSLNVSFWPFHSLPANYMNTNIHNKEETAILIENQYNLGVSYGQNEIKEGNQIFWISTLLFHFCTVLSLISISQIRDVLKCYLLGISKISKISFGIFKLCYTTLLRLKLFNVVSFEKNKFSLDKQWELEKLEQFFPTLFGSWATTRINKNKQLLDGQRFSSKLSKPFGTQSSVPSNLGRGQLKNLPKNKQKGLDKLNKKRLLALQLIKDSDPNIRTLFNKEQGQLKRTSLDVDLQGGQAYTVTAVEGPLWFSGISKDSSSLGSYVSPSIPRRGSPSQGSPAFSVFKTKVGLAKMLRSFIKKPILLAKSINLNDHNPLLFSKVLLTKASLFTFLGINLVLSNGYSLYSKTNFISKKTLNAFRNFGPKYFANFGGKPGEFIIDWIAYLFLVEWISDIRNTIPENVDVYLGNSFYKLTRQVYSLNFYVFLQSLYIAIKNETVLNSIQPKQPWEYTLINPFLTNSTVKPSILEITETQNINKGYQTSWPSKGGEFFDIAKESSVENYSHSLRDWFGNFSIMNLASSFIQRRIYHLYEILSFQFYQPDTDLSLREKKGAIFFDIWGDFLMQVASKSKMDLSELASVKEEQIKLVEKATLWNSGDHDFEENVGGFKGPKISQRQSENKAESNKNSLEFRFSKKHKGAQSVQSKRSGFANTNSILAKIKLKGEKSNLLSSIVRKNLSNTVLGSSELAMGKGILDLKMYSIPIGTVPVGTRPIGTGTIGTGLENSYVTDTNWGPSPFSSSLALSSENSEEKIKVLTKQDPSLPFALSQPGNGYGGAQQFLSYQGKDTDLFIDLYPPKSFTMVSLLKQNESVQTTIGSLVCQIFAGIMYKQIAKNVLIIGPSSQEGVGSSSVFTNAVSSTASLAWQDMSGSFIFEQAKKSPYSFLLSPTEKMDSESSISGKLEEKTLLIQAIAGETEFKMITDNAYRYAMVYKGVAVGIKLLRDVFDSLSLYTPCLFLIEDIHAIGERRPSLISDDEKEASPNGKPVFGSQQDEVHEKNLVLYQLSKHIITHYRKPFRGDFSLVIPTNHFCFELFRNDTKSLKPNQMNPYSLSLSSPKISIQSNNANNVNDSTSMLASPKKRELQNSKPLSLSTLFSSFGHFSSAKHASILEQSKKQDDMEKSIFTSRLLFKSSEAFSPPATSPFSILNLKEEKRFKPHKMVTEIPWGGLSGEQLVHLSKASYSIRVKVAILADMAISTLSVKLDMITDLLVIIDSVKANRGFVVFATTHVPNILDPALRRPGRLDETITLGSFPNVVSRWGIFKSSFGLFSIGKQQTGFHSGVSMDLTYSINSPFLRVFNKQTKTYKDSLRKNPHFSPFNTFGSTSVPDGALVNRPIGTDWQLNSSSLAAAKLQPVMGVSQNSTQSKPTKISIVSSGKNYKKRYLQKILSQTYFISSNMLYEANLPRLSSLNKGLFLKSQNKIQKMNPNQNVINSQLKYYHNSNYNSNFLDNLQPLNMETSSLYLSLYAPPSQFKNQIIKLISGKLGEMLLFSSSFKHLQEPSIFSSFEKSTLTTKNTNFSDYTREFKAKVSQSNQNITSSPEPHTFAMEGPYLQQAPACASLSNTWKVLSSLILSFVQKRFLLLSNSMNSSVGQTQTPIINNNLIIPKLLHFNNQNSLYEVPSPPASNILLPARRYENYRRSFDYFTGKTTNIGISEVLQTHQQQRLVKKLYGFPVQNSFKSESVENRLISFTNATLMIGSLSSILQKPSHSNWFVKNRILARHKNYLTNQWWNGQLHEHNAETTFLSDIDWRFCFIESLGDLLLDFPDADQHYNPQNRRWLLTKGHYHNWFDFEKTLYSEIYTHFIFDSFVKAYHIYEKNRQTLDFYSFYVLRKGLYNSLNEFETINLYKRFFCK